MEWFTIEEIDDKTFAISEYGHWEEVHSYLLIGTKMALLIDTGLGIGNIKNVVDKLTSLPVKVVTTHLHWDHIGGHNLFYDICVHKEEEEWFIKGIPLPLNVVKSNITKDMKIENFPKEFNIDKYCLFKGEPTKIIEDNEIIDLGFRKIKVIHTPGHSPGHICLFEEERGFLYSGDLIYLGTLYAFYPTTNPVQFRDSIKKICDLKGVKKILPAHFNLNVPLDLSKRINDAFGLIEKKELLRHGGGLYEFGDFSIKL